MKDLKEKLDRMFHPKVVAVVGAKKDSNYQWLRSESPVQELGGKVYHVNIDQNEWPGAEELGFENVSSLLDIPEPVDYVVVAVPAQVTPFIMKDAVAKKVGGMHFYTAGFSETGTKEGAELEATIKKMAEDAGIPVIGPNCLGIFHPKVGLRQGSEQYYGEDGSMGYISQSGSLASGFSMEAKASGLNISKSISFGNGTVVDCTELLVYLSDDTGTKLIGMYLEGVRDGRAFFNTLRETAKKKPVLIWKVGLTEDAARATASHTRSISSSRSLWEALFRQTGAIGIRGMDDMVATAKALIDLPPITGNRAALLAVTGGHASEMTEVFTSTGLLAPAISDSAIDEIASYASRVGGSFRNPFEGPSVRTEENLEKTLTIIGNDPNIDFVAMEVAAGSGAREPGFVEGRIRCIKSFQSKFNKPICVVITPSNPFVPLDLREIERSYAEQGIVAFQGNERAAKALLNAYNYCSQREYLYGPE